MHFITFNFKRQLNSQTFSMRRLTLEPYGQLRNSWLSVWQC